VVVGRGDGGAGKKRWWWWEESNCQTNIVCLFGKESHMFKFTCEIITCMISCDDLRLVPWKPPDVPRNSIFFSRTGVGLCTELQDITIERQFPLYSVQIPPECQIPRSVRRNSGTQAGFQAEYQGESKDLATSLTATWHLYSV